MTAIPTEPNNPSYKPIFSVHPHESHTRGRTSLLSNFTTHKVFGVVTIAGRYLTVGKNDVVEVRSADGQTRTLLTDSRYWTN